MPFLWLVQTSSTGGQRSCCHDETCLTLYEGDDRQLWMDFCTWMKANEHKIKLQKRKNKYHALTSSNERIDQNSNIWSEWYTNMSDGYIQENHEKSKSGTMRRQLWQKRFWGGLPSQAMVALKSLNWNYLGYVGIWEIHWAPSGGCTYLDLGGWVGWDYGPL